MTRFPEEMDRERDEEGLDESIYPVKCVCDWRGVSDDCIRMECPWCGLSVTRDIPRNSHVHPIIRGIINRVK